MEYAHIIQATLCQHQKWYATESEFLAILTESNKCDAKEALVFLQKLQMALVIKPAENEENTEPMVYMPGCYEEMPFQFISNQEGLYIDFHGFMPRALFCQILKEMQEGCDGKLEFNTPCLGVVFSKEFDFQVQLFSAYSIALVCVK